MYMSALQIELTGRYFSGGIHIPLFSIVEILYFKFTGVLKSKTVKLFFDTFFLTFTFPTAHSPAKDCFKIYACNLISPGYKNHEPGVFCVFYFKEPHNL